MYGEDVYVNIKGFIPSQSTETEMKAMTEILQSESPSDSSLSATFIKSDGTEFWGSVRISSSEGSFITEAIDQNLSVVVTELVARSREKLNQWKISRVI